MGTLRTDDAIIGLCKTLTQASTHSSTYTGQRTSAPAGAWKHSQTDIYLPKAAKLIAGFAGD